MAESESNKKQEILQTAEKVLKIGALTVCSLVGLDVITDGSLDAVIFGTDMPWKNEPEIKPPLQPTEETISGSAWEPLTSNDLTENEDMYSGGTYTVQRGDSLWEIAEKLYGRGELWKAIFQANQKNTEQFNKIENKDFIYIGETFKIPSEKEAIKMLKNQDE